MTTGQAVIFAVGLSFLVFILAGDYGFQKIKLARARVGGGR